MEIAKKSGVSKEAENFFAMLAENGRLNKLLQIVNAYETIMRAHKGDLVIEVTTAEVIACFFKFGALNIGNLATFMLLSPP